MYCCWVLSIKATRVCTYNLWVEQNAQLDGPHQTLDDEWVTVFVNANGKATPKWKILNFKVMGQSLYCGNELVQEKVVNFLQTQETQRFYSLLQIDPRNKDHKKIITHITAKCFQTFWRSVLFVATSHLILRCLFMRA